MQQAGGIFKTRFIMMRDLFIYRTSKVDGGGRWGVLMWSCVGHCSLRITTSSPPSAHVSKEMEREKNRKDTSLILHSHSDWYECDYWFAFYKAFASTERLCVNVWMLLSYVCLCWVQMQPNLVGNLHSVWKEAAGQIFLLLKSLPL